MHQKAMIDSLRSLLFNLQVDVIVAKVQNVCDDWKPNNPIHSFNRMYFIIEGSGPIEVDGTAYQAKPGQLILLPCHTVQSFPEDSDASFHKYWCHFTARVGSRDLFELYRFPVCLEAPDPSEVKRWFQQIVDCNADLSPAAILHSRSALLSLLGLYLQQPCEMIANPAAAAQKMNCVLQYIEQHLDQKITIEQLAGLAHYHPNYFIRAFHTLLGCSPMQYMNRLRVEKARQLLASDQSIGSIAQAVGMEQHNFSTMFKNHTGFAPRDFRRMLKL
ncbi:AraC family transcriptional regulator [Paenibacillus oryzisoli]|uniref:AraC family transcriptional regulator n=1 Tax=Paenibacillus oryzisoli TaxID=1850517 RepID=UPI003D2CDE8D